MPKKNYYLDTEKTEPLQVEWRGMYKDMKVTWNNNVIMTFENKKELNEGKTFNLDEKRVLSVQFVKRGFSEQGLEILVNNEPVRGSATDPYGALKGVYGLIFFLAGLNLLIGIIAEVNQVEMLQAMGIGIGSIIAGVIFGVLGFFVKEKQSMIALILAMVLLAADMVITMAYMAPAQNGRINTGFYVKIFFIIALFRGIGAIKKIKNKNKSFENAPLDQF